MMQRFFVYIFILILGCQKSYGDSPLKLWYKQPAANWNEALPIGNGRLGAMIYGRVGQEIIQLNEESLVGGSHFNNNNPKAIHDMGTMQQLLLDGRNNEAHELAKESLLASPSNFRSYQTLGKLQLEFQDVTNFTGYERNLDLRTAVSSVSYSVDGVRYKREFFASAPDNSIVIRISADKPGKLNFKANLFRELDASVVAIDDNTLFMDGQIMDVYSKSLGPGGLHMKFNTIAKIIPTGGESIAASNGILVSNADEVLLLVTAATDYNLELLDFDRNIDAKKLCEDIISNATKYNYTALLDRHIQEYGPAFERVHLDLGGLDHNEVPTDMRLDNMKKGQDDKQLVALYFQYGRYLLLSSSRSPGVLPANLQGIWNDLYEAPWKSDYHTNVNLQMNYWPADVSNLSETVIPYVNFVDKLRVPGRIAARETYGASGWMIHHSTDVFGKTGVHSGIHWATSPLSGVWLCLNLWEHYRFTGDKKYLKETLYPIMRESATFVQSFLISDRNGYLAVAPSLSPENSFILPNGQKDQLTYSPTIDIQLIISLYNACLEAGAMLQDDDEFLKGLQMTLNQLPPMKISERYGTIQEWIEDYEEAEPGHRHISHLLGLYPGDLITPSTPELFDAARKTLERRLAHGGGHTGWSRAWIINFYARLLDGESAWQNVKALLEKSTLNNLFDTHPPFQIDGNFGGAAGIAEMLIQSHNGYIELLPAIPLDWESGSCSGLVARGSFEVEMRWENNQLADATIFSKNGGIARIKYNQKIIEINTESGKKYSIKDKLGI